MRSSTGGEDNDEVPPRPAQFAPDQWRTVVEALSVAVANEVVRRLSPQQDNSLAHAELTKLNELRDTPEIKETKRRNRISGLHWASAIRRYQRAGIDRHAAMVALASVYHQSAFYVGVMVKLANEGRRKRIDAMRRTLIPIWSGQGAEPADIARKLNVSTPYARRLLIDVRWLNSAEQEATA